ncbi:hypothetical protein [Hyphomonas sp.]|uniref:hypothetical protein n=1 Tax=Hyphomonas sp. TaxID=87 RepID=UPI00391A0998
MRRTRAALAALAGALALAGPAGAHAGFVMPDKFRYPACGMAAAIASFSDRFPAPEVALESGSFALVGPDGEVAGFGPVHRDAALVRLAGALPGPGVYRLTSGERLGRMGRVAVQGGRYVRLGAAADDPDFAPGTEILSSQAVTVSEAYFGCGDSLRGPALAPQGTLSIEPDSLLLAPGAAAAGFTVRFDGVGLAPQEAYHLTAYGAYAGEGDGVPVTVEADGRVMLAGLTPGIHALLVRHIAPAPEEAASALRSYSAVLAFEVAAAD